MPKPTTTQPPPDRAMILRLALKRIARDSPDKRARDIARAVLDPAVAPRDEETRKPLTDAQQMVLSAIESHIADRGIPPSVRELQEDFGFKSPNGVACHIRALVRKGYLTLQKNMSRTMKPI